MYGRNVKGPTQILRELWSVEETDEHARLTYQYVIDLRKLAQDNVRKLDIKQNACYDKRARSRKFDVGDKVLLLLPSESNKVLLQWNGPYEVLEVVNVMNYKVNVKGIVNTYPANMLKLYVERQNVTSYRSAVIDAHCYVRSKDHRDPTVQRVIVDTVTSNNVTCGDVTSVKDSPSQVSISERDEELRAEATDPVRSVTPNRGNAKRDVKLTSDVKVAETSKGGDFHLVFDHTYPYSSIPSEARQLRYKEMLDFGIRYVHCQRKFGGSDYLSRYEPILHRCCVHSYFFLNKLRIKSHFILLKKKHSLTLFVSH